MYGALQCNVCQPTLTRPVEQVEPVHKVLVQPLGQLGILVVGLVFGELLQHARLLFLLLHLLCIFDLLR